MNKICTLCREPKIKLHGIWFCNHCDRTACGSNANTCGACEIAAEHNDYPYDDDGENPVPVAA